MPSRSIFFFNRRSALSTDSPFFSLISVKSVHFLSIDPGQGFMPLPAPVRAAYPIMWSREVNISLSLLRKWKERIAPILHDEQSYLLFQASWPGRIGKSLSAAIGA